jgi:CheY-like chemotaxis protein
MRPRILIVDDDMATLDIMTLYLEDIAIVTTVNGGRQALEYVNQYPVDLILLDVEMPLMDGFVTLEHLRNIEECINVPVILVTGHKDKSTIINSCLMGVDGYLIKPVEKDTLINKVNEVYESRRAKDNRLTVLLIDDDLPYLKQLNTMLNDSYNVVMINSAKLALNYLMKNTPDVIILDYQMPLYNGANVMNMIQKNNVGRPIPIIILSGALDRSALHDCYIYNPAALLAKPVTKELLIETIKKAID